LKEVYETEGAEETSYVPAPESSYYEMEEAEEKGGEEPEKEGISLWIIIGGIIVALCLIIFLVVFLLKRNKGDGAGINSELASIYSQGKNRGLTNEQITQGLISKGWDRETLSKFLKR
jgi:ATP-dependent Zn protease